MSDVANSVAMRWIVYCLCCKAVIAITPNCIDYCFHFGFAVSRQMICRIISLFVGLDVLARCCCYFQIFFFFLLLTNCFKNVRHGGPIIRIVDGFSEYYVFSEYYFLLWLFQIIAQLLSERLIPFVALDVRRYAYITEKKIFLNKVKFETERYNSLLIDLFFFL